MAKLEDIFGLTKKKKEELTKDVILPEIESFNVVKINHEEEIQKQKNEEDLMAEKLFDENLNNAFGLMDGFSETLINLSNSESEFLVKLMNDDLNFHEITKSLKRRQNDVPYDRLSNEDKFSYLSGKQSLFNNYENKVSEYTRILEKNNKEFEKIELNVRTKSEVYKEEEADFFI